MSTAAPNGGRLQRLRAHFDSLGALDGSLYLLDQLLQRASAGRLRVLRYHVVAQPLTGSAAAMRPDGKTVIVPADSQHPLVGSFPRPPAVIAQRFANGAQCLLATVAGQFAGYLWWQTGHYDEDEVRCQFVLAQPARSVWDFDVYVEPRYRLGRTMARLWQAAEQHLQQQGVAWSCSRISTYNAASLNAHARLGARTVASALFIVVGPLQLSLFNQRPGVHLALGRSSRPVLRVAPP
ncbi:MAG: N-acetyltransferase [Burkholderiales bacterium PBB5]|nr:MAG: N-acetyltransferase [Burkholderiales bacterium PBB5]